LEILGFVELDLDAYGLWKAPGEELHLLEWREGSRVRKARLEGVQVGLDRRGEGQASQIGEVIGADWRPEALMTEVLECLPVRHAGVVFQYRVPL
jgi:hypothetical protein